MGNVVVDNVLLCLDLREGECLFWSLLSPTSHNLIKACFIYPPPLFHSTLKLFYFIFVSSYFCLRPLTSFSLHSHTLVPQLSSPDDVDSLQFDDIRWLLSPSWNNRFVPPLPIPPGADRLSCFPPSPSSSSYSSSPSLFPHLSSHTHNFFLSSPLLTFLSKALPIRDSWNQYQYLRVKTSTYTDVSVFFLKLYW